MKTVITLITWISIINVAIAQDITPANLGFEKYTLNNEELGNVNYFLSSDTTNVQKPLLVYLDGSGAFPLFQKVQGGIGSTVVIDFQRLKKQYRILLISKPGVPFIDDVKSDANGFPRYDAPSEYVKRISLDWRMQSANQIINHLIEVKKMSFSKVVTLGFSEGAQVGPKLAKFNKYITHLMLFGGNGLNQLFDPIITARLKATRGQISEVAAQKEIDSLFNVYKSIYNSPKSIEKNWWGHTYKRWASFTQNDPYKYLLDLNIPIYIANGSLDENSVLSADYIQLEFIKNQKSNLHYKTYPNHNHQFNEIIIENGAFKEAIPRVNFVMKEAFEWLEKQ